VSAGYWILGLTFVALALMAGGHAYDSTLDLDDGFCVVSALGLSLSGFLLAIGFVHALFSSRRRGAPAAFVGLVLCGALAIGAYLYVERTSTRVYHTTFGTCLGRYVTPPPANFERDFFQAPGRGEWLRTALDGSIPPARLVRMADRLYIQCEPTLGYRSSARVALAVQRLVDLELDGHFERAILEIPAGDWAFNSRLDSLPRRN
jgi:hypothetical protein